MAASVDEQHLDLLSIGFFLVGGLTGRFACIPFIHVGVGIGMLTGSFGEPPGIPSGFMGVLFVVAGTVAIVLGWASATLLVLTGWSLRRHERYGLCQVGAVIACVLAPLGTVLGILALLVLARPSVRALFGRGKASPAGLVELE